LPARLCTSTLCVMESDDRSAIAAVREWLQSERRLGVTHWATGPVRERARKPAQTATVAATPTLSPAVVHTAAPVTPGLFVQDPSLPPICTRELPPAEAAAALSQLDAGCVRPCVKCRLHSSRTQTVFGVGNPRPQLVFVGEGPGADEDAQGEPFVGRAGQLLTRMIAAMTLTREQVYICNVVKCRPPGNRTPSDDEMETCSPYLLRQLAILRPKVIVTLGRPATQTLLATRLPITRIRGQWADFPPPAFAGMGLPPAKLMPTYHPAYLLRNPAAKAEVWKDLQEVMRVLGLKVPQKR
jgi:uracil-DNA glycosylase family 4